ncbi:hypothetical protein [Staphylococcus haemolyticus]|uniref:hypothetical protein n=1 Tax=Staphylococcus haemolyticus TaxID=1283 RepID=UPI001F33D214|nr:hypothetical protein [Staphylococcus haemolyticus]MCE4992716.1 hypothetical protein [Staphylococcus haemolyticus]
MRIQNRWIIFSIFTIIAFIVVTCLTIYKNEKTINLTEVKINDIQLNEPFNENDYEINHHIKLDRYKFYNDKKHKDLIVKVKNKHQTEKGIVLINDHDVTTNFGVKIGDRVDHAINYLGDNYRKDKVGKGYDALIYVDKEHHMKLSILYKDNVVKRIEFFSR